MPAYQSSLTPAAAVTLLRRRHLLREIINGERWTLDARLIAGFDAPIASLTYDTRKADAHSLLFIKGQFKPEFLAQLENGAPACYVAERDYSRHTDAPGIIVDDVQQAMSLLAAQFYGNPQRSMTLIGITGTKGKTTTAYFTHAILQAVSHGRAALSSSLVHCMDGEHFEPSHLTTPESLDVFRMMREAAGNGMRYFVMEVSSQAYKRERVFGLTFDVGAFLNISPDHISPIEHPTFEDYFYCKRQIIANSRALVLGADCAHADLLREDAAASGIAVTSFALHDQAAGLSTPADVIATDDVEDPGAFSVDVHGTKIQDFRLSMHGEFNIANAAAAIAIALEADVAPDDAALQAVNDVHVPGRMERFVSRDGIIAYVDYAHNYLSTKTLLDEIERRYAGRNPRIVLVAGSTGGKALDRREGIVKGALGRAESFVFTTDDPNHEDPAQIARQMRSYVTDSHAATHIVIDRAQAIGVALQDARAHPDRLNILVLIGKGNETANIIDGRPEPYLGDATVIAGLFAQPADM
ncbi:Mur ligase family protein [Bifidobacterium sp.]|jgi:UDP-N-acetylmuramoyl-L-alanyl-D-glutamate--2,6-diaminopimelate ligase|uniref:Mur ligase family protein n=1 Tax=Bifidobacterium sp. TaxID=41200 RepID=UPI0025C518F0|nr:Mur ligase family protein [Bifidobacterium sp.]MCH4208754.1 UDP-N-acetylmuramoyl-L-alanyl-D-glutamate--2,6-diaminopimelate ligase [Bifidobacterium sp.]MCI1224014.1 Mur ligase family protein [Bifidobacterium sp.]